MTLKFQIINFFRLTSSLLTAVFLTTLLFSCSGNKKVFKAVEIQLEQSPVFKQGFTGVMIYDPEEKRVLYQYNADKYFTPASNTKLFTFYTGLKILGDSVPALRYTIRNDSLIFGGTGDPSLLNPHLPPSDIVAFFKESKADLFYLPPKSEESSFGPGWAWDDYNEYYSVERSTFPIYGNEVTFKVEKFQKLPQAYPGVFQDSLVLDSLLLKGIQRDLSKNKFRYTVQNNGNFDQTVPFKTSAKTAINLLTDTLERPIKILPSAFPADLTEERYSVSTDSLYKRMLQESDNFIAEQILILAANEIGDTLKADVAIRYMKKNVLMDLPHETRWVDGSGLSRYNLTTPQNMVSLLGKILDEVNHPRLFELLPAGGESGTLENQFVGKSPFIFAKTGSLSNNYSLSGYLITKTGKILIFSFMNSNFVTPTSMVKREMEKMLLAIRNHN